MAKKKDKPATDAKADKAAPAGASPSAVLGIAVTAGAAVIASFAAAFFLSPAPAPQIAACDTPASAHTPALAGAKPDQAFVTLKELLITVGSEPATRYLKINLSIATHAEGVDAVKANEAVLIDAFNIYLRSVELTDFEDPAFYLHLRDQLSRRAELVLGGEVSEGVLITEFLLR